MTSLSDKPISGETSLKFEDQIYDDRKRKVILRKRIIEGSKEYGLPTATDDSVILALIQLTKQKNGFVSREVEFSRHELIQLLQWPNKGQSYERIAQSLHRLASVTYHFENSWWDNRRKAWTTKIFGIIDNVDLNDSRESDSQGGLFASRITWNQTVLDSFQAGYLRSLDFQLAISFKHAISMRIYRFMGKRFHHKKEWALDLKDFAYEHIGLSRNYEGGTQIVRKLKPAISELEDAGFLEALPDGERFSKKGRDWTIRLVAKASPLPAMAEIAAESNPLPSLLVTELIKRDVTDAVAETLVKQYSADLIQAKINVLDWLIERKDKRVGKSPAGYLVKSITTGENGYKNPPGYTSKAERDRQAEVNRQAAQKAEEDRRRKAAADAQGRQLIAQVNAFRKSCPAARLAQLEADAIAHASEETRLTLDQPFFKKQRESTVFKLVEEHIARLIESGELTPEPA